MALISLINIKQIKNTPGFTLTPTIGFILIFGLYLISGLLSSSISGASTSRIIELKMLYISIPIAFLYAHKLSNKHVFSLLWVFIIGTAITALLSTSYYLINLERIHQSYEKSKIMPLAGNHIRYSLLIVSAILSCYYLYTKSTYAFFYSLKKEKKIILIIGIFLVIFLHILAVRSGLFAYYATLGLIILSVLLKRKQSKKSIKLLPILLIPLCALFLLPTARTKIENTINDLQKYNSVYSANYQSMTARLFSWKAGFEVFKENPYFGTGIGDLKEDVDLVYIAKYATIKPNKRLIPHNQFLYCLAAIGILGTSIYFLLFYLPLFSRRSYTNTFILGQYLIISTSFLVEATLETFFGIAYTLFVLHIAILVTKKEQELDTAKL